MGQRWVSVTPLGLMQDYALSSEHLQRGRDFVAACVELVQAAAQTAILTAGGVERTRDMPKL